MSAGVFNCYGMCMLAKGPISLTHLKFESASGTFCVGGATAGCEGRKRVGRAHLGEERQDGDAGMAANDGHRHALGRHANGLCHKGVRT